MEPLQFLVPVGRLEAHADALAAVALALAAANLGTRWLAHRRHVEQAADGADAVSRYLPHTVTTLALVLVSFAFAVVEPHGGTVLSVFVLTTLVADFFEFEARRVEARNGMTIERPKSALTASLLVVVYAGYQSLFFVVAPLWDALV